MRKQREQGLGILLVGVVACAAFAACSKAGAQDQPTGFAPDGAVGDAAASADASASHDGKRPAPSGAEAYYFVRRDVRRCAFPLCGGYFVRQVNRETTPCPGGSRQPECYVATLDWSALGLPADRVTDVEDAMMAGRGIILGRMGPSVDERFGDLGQIAIREAWQPATANPPSGRVYRLSDSGIRCIAAPCFSIREQPLNLPGETRISDVDLRPAGASEAQMTQAQEELFRSAILAVGEHRTVPNAGPAGAGYILVATQFYLRVGSD